MSIHKIINEVVSFIAHEWSLGKLNSFSDFDKIARTFKNRFPSNYVTAVKVQQVLGILNARDVVSIYDTYHPLVVLWRGSVEEVPERYKSEFCFSMKHNDAGYQLYI